MKLTSTFVSIILTLSLILSLSTPIYAVEKNYNGEDLPNTSENTEAIEAAREAYLSLSPEAKAVFDASLANDAEAIEFHKTYIDKNFNSCFAEVNLFSAVPTAAASVDAMTVLMGRLNAIGLPAPVLSSLRAMGASLVIDIADGPLLVGTILVAASTAAFVTVAALNWEAVSPHFNQIVFAFRSAFASAAANISTAFSQIRTDSQKEAKKLFDKSATDAVNGCDSNKRNHIINNKIHDHNWKKLFNGKDPNWNQLAPILIKALKEGSESAFNKSMNIYERALSYRGYTVVVRFIKALDGTVKAISTAYLK